MRRPSGMIVICGVLFGAIPSELYAHPGHVHDIEADASGMHADERFMLALAEPEPAIPAAAASQPGITGEGKYRFRVLYKSDHLPEKAVEVLVKAHGGFAVDRRDGKGDIYFALPGAGIVQISGDLKKTKLLDTAEAVRDTNQHNTMIWYGKDDLPYLTFPADEAGKVFTTTIEGKLVHTLDRPTENDDVASVAKEFYKDPANPFKPTDVEQLDGMYYIPTGYSKLDYVLTAKITLEPFNAVWSPLAFGGKGDAPGQFGTGHGITVPKGEKRIDVADRPKAEIDRFSPDGKYLSTVELPEGSYPCDVSYEGKRAVVGCLIGPNKEKGAPIYILEDDKLVSTLMPKEDLGLENFKHVHNAIGVTIKKKMYVIAQAWNPGDFAILEQVSD